MVVYSNNLMDYDFQIQLAKSGSGKFGNVLLARHIPSDEHVAIKKFCLENSSFENFKIICDELYLMRQFNHPNVDCILNSFVYASSLYIVSPLYCFGSCKDTIQNCFETGFPEVIIALILLDILSALSYLHSRSYIHGSIRASHILLNQRKAVLSSFRETRCCVMNGKQLKVLHGLSALNKDSINWLAPEVLEQNLNGYNEKSDVYSIGITCCELANGIHPFYDTQPTFMYTEKVRGNMPTLLDQSTWTLPNDTLDVNLLHTGLSKESQKEYCSRIFSDDFHQLTEICTNIHPTNRWSAIQLMSHSFFKQCKYTNLSDQLKNYGLVITDYTKIQDNMITSNEANDLNYVQNLIWDF